VAAHSKAWVCGRSVVGITGSNPAGAWMSVSCECCVLPGRGPCVELITLPKGPTDCCVCECDREASIMKRPWPTRSCCARERNIINVLRSSCKGPVILFQLTRPTDGQIDIHT
jgi:hypothetical protein